MTSKKKSGSEPDKILAQTRPKIREQLIARLKQLGPGLKEISQGALLGVFLGGIAAPLAAIDAGPLAQTISQMVGGVGGNILATLIQRFYDADSAGNEAEKEAVLNEILGLVESNARNSEAVLDALQQLIAKVDAMAAVQEVLGREQVQWVETQFQALRLIPADFAGHRRFAREVKKLLNLRGDRVEENFRLSDEHRADFLVTHHGFGGIERTIVQCVTTRQGRADEKLLDPILRRLHKAKEDNLANYGIIITETGLSPAAQSLAEDYGWKIRWYDQLLSELMDFSYYLDKLCDDFINPHPDSELPALRDYYVSLKARKEFTQKEAKPFDLLKYVQKWIERPSPTQPLMLLGEYGTGKTTFCRKLAFELAQSYQQAQDLLVSGKNIDGPRPRMPLLINLLHFVEIGRLDALITHYLSRYCGVDRPRYELFETLNRAGFFVIILDGFDEMAVRMDDKTIEKHLKQIEQLAASEESRVLVTGRPEIFKSREELASGMSPRRQPLAHRFKDFETLKMELWDNDQILEFLKRLVPYLPNRTGDGKDYYTRIQKIPGFADDLAQRAVLLEMIARTLPQFDEKTPVTRPNLYALYLKRELERQRIKKGRELLLDDKTRFELLQKLAADSYKMEGGGIHWSEAAALVKPKLPAEEAASDIKTEHHSREFLSCSFLRPGPGDLFVFSHRSFRGYLAAKEIMPRLLDGSVEPQPIDQDCIGFLAEMLEEPCTPEFYKRQVREALARDGLPSWIEEKKGRFYSKLPTGFLVEMVYVPPGPCVLGEEGIGFPPQITVLEKGVWIDKTPVTIAQFREFVKAAGYITMAEKEGGTKFHKGEWIWSTDATWRDPFALGNKPEKYSEHPVVQISWDDARAFCKWAGKRLPAERQWEKAARGIDGRRWPWGNIWNRNSCNSASWWAKRDLWDYDTEWKPWSEKEFPRQFAGKQVMTTKPGSFKENESPYNTVDCAGNVWEWCGDFYDEKKETRVLRGGAWNSPPQDVVCAGRNHDLPGARDDLIGFRCART